MRADITLFGKGYIWVFFVQTQQKLTHSKINEERGGMKSIHTADQTYTQSVTTKHVTWHHSSDSDSNII